jgi:tetratricopeptide (TPR) repeat protein
MKLSAQEHQAANASVPVRLPAFKPTQKGEEPMTHSIHFRTLAVVALLGFGSLAITTTTASTPATTTHAAMAEPAKGPSVDSWAEGAQLFDDLGTLHRRVTTSSTEAQAYFDQGLRLAYSFNHDEAARSFARAAQLDPNCASCFWGVALTLGLNYNVPMLSDRAPVAWAALTKAKELAPRASPVEQQLIQALSKRYGGAEPLEPPAMHPFNEAYATTMREVAKKFPEDDDVQALFAEALMDVNPWKLWTRDGKANPGTDEIVATLETVIKRNVNHPGANHYYIHTLEASPYPEKALPSADRLAGLIPAAGHLVHMPAHIYQRVGRYPDATESNRRAVEVDKKYLASTTPPALLPDVHRSQLRLPCRVGIHGRSQRRGALGLARGGQSEPPPRC